MGLFTGEFKQMKKRVLATILVFLAAFAATITPVQASQIAGESAVLKNSLPAVDAREEKLREFLKSYDSPLVPYAANFIDAADEWQIDWRLVPAITGVESSFGRQIPLGSYNAYGWANGTYYFKSWEGSISHVSRVIKKKYVDRGLDTPYKIGPVYAPPSQTWAGRVVFFMKQIECFGEEICLENLDLTI